MPKIILTKGLPASGKSTWAKEQVAKSHGKIKRVNKDDLRLLLDAGTWSRDREKFVLKVRDSIISEAMEKGLSVIVDDTNLAPKHLSHITQMVESFNKKWEVIDYPLGYNTPELYTVEVNDSFLEVPYKECVKRDKARANGVGERVIRQMYIQYVLKVDKLKQDEDLPNVIICDLDGTLALFGNRNPYERDFENDLVNVPVAKILEDYAEGQVAEWGNGEPKIMFLSGRSDKYRQVTLNWLQANLPTLDKDVDWELHMRKEGDDRSDMIVKKELFDEFVRDKYYVDFVIDDRLQIIDVWRSMGIFVFNVNQTNEEF